MQEGRVSETEQAGCLAHCLFCNQAIRVLFSCGGACTWCGLVAPFVSCMCSVFLCHHSTCSFLQLPVRYRHACGVVTMNKRVVVHQPTMASSTAITLQWCEDVVLALLVYHHGFFFFHYYAMLCIALELLPLSQFQWDQLANRYTAAAARHLLQYPAEGQLALLSPRDVTFCLISV